MSIDESGKCTTCGAALAPGEGIEESISVDGSKPLVTRECDACSDKRPARSGKITIGEVTVTGLDDTDDA